MKRQKISKRVSKGDSVVCPDGFVGKVMSIKESKDGLLAVVKSTEEAREYHPKFLRHAFVADLDTVHKEVGS